jgi:hypothetical protein
MPDHAAAPRPCDELVDLARRAREEISLDRAGGPPAEADDWAHLLHDRVLRLCDLADVLLAERQRLREALERIADHGSFMENVEAVARVALGRDPSQDRETAECPCQHAKANPVSDEGFTCCQIGRCCCGAVERSGTPLPRPAAVRDPAPPPASESRESWSCTNMGFSRPAPAESGEPTVVPAATPEETP